MQAGRGDLAVERERERESPPSVITISAGEKYLVVACEPGWTEEAYRQAIAAEGLSGQPGWLLDHEIDEQGREVFVIARDEEED